MNTKAEFERFLDILCDRLKAEISKGAQFSTSRQFEDRVRELANDIVEERSGPVDFKPDRPYVFPDIVMGDYGIEVKFTANDTWRSVANSVFESTRGQGVKYIYVVFGKFGGDPSVSWGRYDDCVIHVRTSHVPRFEVEVPPRGTNDPRKASLFEKIGVSYEDFSGLSLEDRMQHIRRYARGRLKHGERLWWLEDRPGEPHTLPLEVRLYTALPQGEKRRFRAEAALLCPQIVKPSRTKRKYNDAVMYLLTYYGVLCPQARDLFSAGSVALRANPIRGGNYLMRALLDIEEEMRVAAASLEDALFVEYWGASVSPDQRIDQWLKKADAFAISWKPSEHLFLEV